MLRPLMPGPSLGRDRRRFDDLASRAVMKYLYSFLARRHTDRDTLCVESFFPRLRRYILLSFRHFLVLLMKI